MEWFTDQFGDLVTCGGCHRADDPSVERVAVDAVQAVERWECDRCRVQMICKEDADGNAAGIYLRGGVSLPLPAAYAEAAA